MSTVELQVTNILGCPTQRQQPRCALAAPDIGICLAIVGMQVMFTMQIDVRLIGSSQQGRAQVSNQVINRWLTRDIAMYGFVYGCESSVGAQTAQQHGQPGRQPGISIAKYSQHDQTDRD